MLLTEGKSVLDSRLKKGLTDLDTLRGEHSNVDFRFGIVEANTQEALTMVLDLDESAVSGRLGQPENGAVVDPRMARQDAIRFARFQEDSWQRFHNNCFAEAAVGRIARFGKRRNLIACFDKLQARSLGPVRPAERVIVHIVVLERRRCDQ